MMLRTAPTIGIQVPNCGVFEVPRLSNIGYETMYGPDELFA